MMNDQYFVSNAKNNEREKTGDQILMSPSPHQSHIIIARVTDAVRLSVCRK